jgi:phage gp29-like protein
MPDTKTHDTKTRLPADLGNEIATVARDPYNIAAKLRYLLPLDDTLATRGGGRGLKIYDEIERDARAFAVLQKRKMALLAYPWDVVPASEDGPDVDAADLVKAQLGATNFRQATLGLQDALLKGFAVGECMWEVVDGVVTLAEIRARDQRRFRFGHDGRPRLLTFENMNDGEELPERKFIVHSTGSKDWSPYGLGLGTRLFWLVYFKRQDITFWLTFLDKFGSPTAVGKYAPSTDPADQAKLLQALFTIAQDSGIIIPESMQVELLEANRSGSVDAYEKAARYFDEEITIAVLGETLSTSLGDVGSQAASSTHNDVRLELVQSDGELMADTWNRGPVRWITEMNIAGARAPLLKFLVAQTEDLTARVNRDKVICDMGFKPTLAYVHATYGGEWEERAPAPAPSPFGADPGPDGPAAFAEGKGDNDLLAAYAERLGAAADPAIADMVGKVRELLDGAGSLDEVRDGLINLYPDIDGASFAEAMELALAAAAGAGALSAKKP